MAERLMKDSGLKSIGTIPDTWKINRLKYLGKLSGGMSNKKPEDFGEGTPFVSYGDIYKNITLKEAVSGKVKATENDINKYSVKYGDTFFTGSSETVDELGLSSTCLKTIENATFNGFSIRFRPQCLDEYNPNFYKYYYRSEATRTYLTALDNSITRANLSQSTLGNLPVVKPSLEEQTKIANFLDKKVSEIDNAIKKTKQSIEEYKKLKQSIITEAVTKGLNPNVEMRDSRIETIGSIPRGWKITKIKYILVDGEDSIKVGPFGSTIRGKMLPEGEYKVYNQAHLIANDFSLNRHFVNEDTFEELAQYQVVPGDVLFSMMGTIGKCQYMPEGYPKGIMDSHLIKGRLDTQKMSKRYFKYAYDKDNSRVVIDQFLKTSKGTIMDGLNSTVIKNVYIPYPDLVEQEQISDYLDDICPKYDSLISTKEQIITELKQYKKSLIYEYVTGKKEVV